MSLRQGRVFGRDWIFHLARRTLRVFEDTFEPPDHVILRHDSAWFLMKSKHSLGCCVLIIDAVRLAWNDENDEGTERKEIEHVRKVSEIPSKQKFQRMAKNCKMNSQFNCGFFQFYFEWKIFCSGILKNS